MKITRFKFDDHGADWHLEEVRFDQLNLLVGVSGVGKTKILEALQRVCGMATGSATSPGKIEWLIEFEHEGNSYQWEGLTGPKPNEGRLEVVSSEEEVVIAWERFGAAGKEPLIDRDSGGFRFRDQTMPPMAELGSALHILKSEKELLTIHHGFSLITLSTAEALKPMLITANRIPILANLITIQHNAPFDGFLSHLVGLNSPTILNAYVLQGAFREKFSQIKDDFIAIFDTLTDVHIQLSSLLGDEQTSLLQFEIQERGSSRWIPQSEISSGMLRTLAHIFEMALARPGSVIIIDEFENGLGVNCMSEVAQLISKRVDYQVIVTSHHPYIINNIPVDAWKLVTRKGGHVRVTSARDIPEMQSASRLEAFTRLINLPQFEEGIQ